MPDALKTTLLLVISNGFMLSAWYLHLNMPSLKNKAWIVAVLISWGIAFFEYLVHIPANRIGSSVFTLSQLQILQIIMSLFMFIPFSIIVMKAPIKIDYIYASICLIFGAYFIFR